MADAKDTQLGHTETPLADDTTIHSPKPNAKTKKDLMTAWPPSPAELENQVAPTTGLAGPPTISGCMVKERQCVSTLTASMEILNWRSPQWCLAARGLQWRNWQKKIWWKAAPECVAHH